MGVVVGVGVVMASERGATSRSTRSVRATDRKQRWGKIQAPVGVIIQAF